MIRASSTCRGGRAVDAAARHVAAVIGTDRRGSSLGLLVDSRTRRTRRTYPDTGDRPPRGQGRPPSCASRWPSFSPPSCHPTRRRVPKQPLNALREGHYRTGRVVSRATPYQFAGVSRGRGSPPQGRRSCPRDEGGVARVHVPCLRSPAVERRPRQAACRAAATAITPPSRRPGWAASAAAISPTWPIADPRRGPCRRRGLPGPGRSARARHARRGAEGTHQPRPVHRVHDVGVPGHAGRLVRLQLADEMPGHCGADRRDLLSLPARFRKPVLPSRSLPARRARPCLMPGTLGDRDQRDLGRVAPRRGAGGGDPGADGREIALKLSSPVRVPLPHLRGSRGRPGRLLFEDHRAAAPRRHVEGLVAPGILPAPVCPVVLHVGGVRGRDGVLAVLVGRDE